jgi:hypothetical protein
MRKLLLVAVLAIAATACKQIDKDKLEGKIKDDLATHKLVIKSVDCPSGRQLKKGDVFGCKVTTDHQVFDAKVTQTDDDGTVSYEVPGRAVNEKAVGDGLESRIGGGIDVQCGDQTGIYRKGDKIKCDTKHPDGTITIVFTDDEGSVDVQTGSAGSAH